MHMIWASLGFGSPILRKDSQMQQQTLSQEMQDCIDACQECHDICLQTAMTQCLRMGGKHVEEDHLRLMINCTEICQTAANFMLSSSPMHMATCAACADICMACAESCERVGDMDECAQACRRCAESCQQMAQGYQPRMEAMQGSMQTQPEMEATPA